MYKALNPSELGISGRQSEIIELALTYGFRGLECDILEYAKRVQVQGLEKAQRFLESAHLKMSGFELPIRWRGEESVFESELQKLNELASYAAAAGAKSCHTTILPATDMYPYHENFELHRKRLSTLAETLGKHGIRLGVSFYAAPSHRADKSFQFIYEVDALIMLIKSVTSEHLGLVLDTWNWHFGGGTPEHVRALGGDRIIGVRVADAPSDATAAALVEEQRTFPQEAGAVNNLNYLTLLVELGFKGPVSLAPHPSNLTGMTREAIVQKVSSTLDELLKGAGVIKAAGGRPALIGAE